MVGTSDISDCRAEKCRRPEREWENTHTLAGVTRHPTMMGNESDAEVASRGTAPASAYALARFPERHTMDATPTIYEVLESHSRIVLAELSRGVQFVRERLDGVSWENIALSAQTTVEDVRECAVRAFEGVEPVPA